MKCIEEMTLTELQQFAASIQGILFLDMDAKGEFWNPNKALEGMDDVIELLVETCEEAGLKPSACERSKK